MVSILLISIGITFIILGIIVFIDKLKLLRDGIRAEGEVIDFEECNDPSISEGKEIMYVTVYKPIIKFRTMCGEMRTFTYDNVQSDTLYKIGDKVSLIYPAEEVENIEVNEKNVLFKLLCKLISLGIMFIVFGSILYIV